MNCKIHSAFFRQPARLVLALTVGITLLAGLRAQAVPIAVDNRYLLIFDTSSAMKKCLPAIKDTVGQLFISVMGGQLKAGDSIGVWTFANSVGTGKFPLQEWQPENAALIASNIVSFVQNQRYAKTTDFKATMPVLNRIVQNSDRLTVIIFCDGDGQLQGTPYDADVNALFKQGRSAMQLAKRPFIVVLRAQLGEYVGCRVNAESANINFPPFPPLPEAPVPLDYDAPASPPPPRAAPVPVGVPLIIVGTKVGTNPPPDLPPTPVLKEPVHPTNTTVPAVVITNIVTITNEETNLPAVVSPAVPVTTTNASAAIPKVGLGSGGALLIGTGLLAMAVVLTVWMMRRVRESGQSSLITRSLDQKNNPPPKP